MQINNKSTCSSSSVAADQKDYSFTLSDSDGCVKNDLLLDGKVTVLDVDESLVNIISKEEEGDMQRSINDKDISKCSDDHSRNKVLIDKE